MREALRSLGPEADARARSSSTCYTDVDPVLWGAAELSVRAQLEYLRRVGER